MMNGRKTDSSPFEHLRLTVDAATLDAALGKRAVQAIDLDGTLIHSDEKTASDILTEQLERIWNEYPNGLLDMSEEKLERLPPDEDSVEKHDATEEKEKEQDPFKMMSRTDMDKLRSEVHEQLNSARNELWFVLELAKTLAVSSNFTAQPPAAPNQPAEAASKKAKAKAAQKANEAGTKASLPTSVSQEPPILPAGTYSTTPSTQSAKPTHVQIHDLELVLAAKQQALDECSALIDSAVSELQMMATAGDRFWRDVRKLKEGENGRNQWAVLPKPDFGRTMSAGEMAKDVIIPYAIDEAAFDLDPTKEDALTFGSRSYLRLRATLKDVSGAVVGSSPTPGTDSSDVRAEMEAAQMEAFDEDLFGELRYEAAQMSKSELDSRAIALPIAEYTLSFELYDTRTSSQTPTSPLCDLMVSSARLNLINLHKYRKTRLVRTVLKNTAAPTILKPILQGLRYRQLCNIVNATLTNFSNLFKTAGLESSHDNRLDPGQPLSDVVSGFIMGESDTATLQISHKLELPGCPGVKIEISAPFRTKVIFNNASFDLANPAQLPHVLAEEFASQLLHLVYAEIRDRLSSQNVSIKSGVFLDELEGTLHLGHLGYLRITIPPPFHNVICNVDQNSATEESITSTGPNQSYDARRDGSLYIWLDGIAESLIASQ
ncbi:uncharacterized protein I206_101179 [Kwoniella pini CBS 10737]|uniref:Mediator of RNA polymerase II transcription subunit 17 n=1 Tax=Kwoniella pini CBS 10737 TaxID=1296096 RepID=A0AAJ8L0Q5_9TREE